MITYIPLEVVRGPYEGGGVQLQGIITYHLLTVVVYVFVENIVTVVPIYNISSGHPRQNPPLL